MRDLQWAPYDEDKEARATKLHPLFSVDDIHSARGAQLHTILHWIKVGDIGPTKAFFKALPTKKDGESTSALKKTKGHLTN